MADKQIIPADQILPNKLFIIPLKGKPIFPGIFTPIMIADNDDIDFLTNENVSIGF
jgi:ATP-dependent Lon protease